MRAVALPFIPKTLSAEWQELDMTMVATVIGRKATPQMKARTNWIHHGRLVLLIQSQEAAMKRTPWMWLLQGLHPLVREA